MGAVELNVSPLEEDLWSVAAAADGADHELVEDGEGNGCGCVCAEVEPTGVIVIGNDIGIWSNLQKGIKYRVIPYTTHGKNQFNFEKHAFFW